METQSIQKESNALAKLSACAPLSKSAQNAFAENMIAQVVNGEADALQAYLVVKAISETCEQFLKHPSVTALAQSQVRSSGEDRVDCDGAQVSLTKTNRYDYSSSGDRQYQELVTQRDELNTKIKAREMYLRALCEKQEILDHETGEVRVVLPPECKSSSTLRVTFKKS